MIACKVLKCLKIFRIQKNSKSKENVLINPLWIQLKIYGLIKKQNSCEHLKITFFLKNYIFPKRPKNCKK